MEGLLFWSVVGTIAAISAWVTTLRVRRRMKRALGRRPHDAELVSLTTWIKVDEAEKEEISPVFVSPEETKARREIQEAADLAVESRRVESLKASRAVQDAADDPFREL